jgi:hypothetical protein
MLRFNVLPVQDERRRLSGLRGDVVHMYCPKCYTPKEDAHHFLLKCPASDNLREELFSSGELLFAGHQRVLEALRGCHGSREQYALLTLPGPVGWPSNKWNSFPIPLHGDFDSLPALGRALHRVSHSYLLDCHKLTFDIFCSAAWSIRLTPFLRLMILMQICKRGSWIPFWPAHVILLVLPVEIVFLGSLNCL